MIIASLRYWVTEVHVDGFRFDLGSIMTRAHSLWQPPSPAAPGDAPASAQGGNGASATWPHVSGAQQPGEHTPLCTRLGCTHGLPWGLPKDVTG